MQLVDVAAFEFRFRALRRAARVTGLPSCPGCPFLARCVYPYIFETAPGAGDGILADYDRVPNPFVLAPPWDSGGMLEAGGETRLRLVLIGRAIDEAALARQAVRAPLNLAKVESIAPPPAAPLPDPVEIVLASPLRLVEGGRLVGPEALRPRHLLLALLRRLSLLAERHAPRPLALDYRALKVQADAAEFAERELRWADWRRWSGRQQQLLPMGGLMGRLVLPLAGLDEFRPFLALAPWLHAGKGTTMGLGAMRIDPP